MKANCEYCGSEIDNTLEECPHCGAKNPNFPRTVTGTPKTIDELKAFCDSKGLKLDTMHIHLGEDFKEPKAFGIYKNEKNGHFVVYKNKDNGQRAIRYQGSDEGYAVNELYQRLRVEIANQKKLAANKKRVRDRKVENTMEVVGNILRFFFLTKFGITVLGFLIAFIVVALNHSPSRGYYRYNGNDYYYQNGSWYSYNQTYDTWDLFDSDFLDDIIYDDTADDYRIYDHDGAAFEDSSWYDSGSSYSSSSSYDSSDYSYDWDSDYSWDSSDSWDYDYSSWDSDW